MDCKVGPGAFASSPRAHVRSAAWRVGAYDPEANACFKAMGDSCRNQDGVARAHPDFGSLRPPELNSCFAAEDANRLMRRSMIMMNMIK
jgi:hypothetical protein